MSIRRDRRICVVGLGYVGLPVAAAFARAGASDVVAFDVDAKRVAELRNGVDRTGEASRDDLAAPRLKLTDDAEDLQDADFFIVAVPTPIDAGRLPDLGALRAASRTVGRALAPGDVVVYESTVYPGATEEVCVPILEETSGLVFGRDFAVGYSPERINPGDRERRFETIVKVVAASDAESLEIVADVYASVVAAGVHRAPNIKTAEAAKVIENTQRDVNIALMNELSVIFHRLGVDTGDVLAAARTKWNFLPFTPGLVGGHCIGVDPYYLTYRAQQAGHHPEVILAGRRLNDEMAGFVADAIVRHLMRRRSAESRVVVLGLTFKPNVPDTRNTKVVDLIARLRALDVDVAIVDPVADVEEAAREYGVELVDAAAAQAAGPADAVVLAVPHRPFVDAGWPLVSGLLRKDGFVADLYGALDRDGAPPGVDLWRL